MVGAGTQAVQARMIPKLAAIIDDYGQDVAVLRAGQPDQTVRAYLYQLDDKAGTTDLSHPEYKTLAWQGIFHYAAALSGQFAVQDALGRFFIPDSPPQDAGEQQVAWIAHLLPTPQRVRVDQLMFSTPNISVPDPRTGNTISQPGTQLPPVAARLVASTDPTIRQMAGADAAEVVLVGRWGTLLTPTLKPDGVGWGSSSPLTLDGRQGRFTLKVALPDPDIVQERYLGARFIGGWKAL